jgi:hypothetical protein
LPAEPQTPSKMPVYTWRFKNEPAKSKFVSLVTHNRAFHDLDQGLYGSDPPGCRGECNEQQAHFLNIIRNNVDRMSTLVSVFHFQH